jgi:AcrR family transcriptional regulator
VLTDETGEDNAIEKRLYRLFQLHADFCRRHRELGGFLFREQQSMGEEFEAWFHELAAQKFRRLRAALRKAMDAGELRSVDMDVLTGVLLGMMTGVMIPAALSGELTEDAAEKTAAGALDILLNGIGSKPGF